MDQIRIGRFIAESRKARNLTQRQLANALSISDKTVSKWECGKGLPEVSLMLPLCAALDLTVNDLLSGERVASPDYQQKAEGNMMSLMKENEENRQAMALSMITGAVTLIAVCALIVIASFLELPAIARVMLLVFSALVAVGGVTAAAALNRKAGYYECPYCAERFVPGMEAYIKGRYTLTRRRLTCPRCGKTGMCRRRVAG